MKKRFRLAYGVVVFVLLLSGCGMKTGKADFPEASAGFQPKRMYAVSYDALWDVVVNALDENRIAIASLDKSTGRIITDYVQGVSTVYALGLGGTGQSRYKYNITMRKTDNDMTKLAIICKLESTLSGAAGSTPWRDLSSENASLVTSLESWLYEQIEKAM